MAFSRCGDKGNHANISVIPYRDEAYSLLLPQLTTDRVAEHFRDILLGTVTRYEWESISILNFVLNDVLHGGVSMSLKLDPHGKSLQSHILSMEVDLPERMRPATFPASVGHSDMA